MKFIFKILAGFTFLISLVGIYLNFLGTSDLRTPLSISHPQPENARALLEKMANAYNVSEWENLETYRLEIEDHFLSAIGSASHPYDEDSVHLMLYYIPNTYTGRLSFLSGNKMGRSWGLQGWKSYQVNSRGRITFKKDSDIYFWLPTYQYFFEFPLRILNADAFAMAGEKIIDGVDCVGIMASWNTIEPQRKIDQYLVWINKETNLIEKIDYTIRDAYNFLTGGIYFKDHEYFEGKFLLPTEMPIESNLTKEGFLHKIILHDFESNYMSIEKLSPDSNLDIGTDDKPAN